MTVRRAMWRPILIGAGVGALGALFFLVGALRTWSHLATDRFFLPRNADTSIVIVAIDDTSIAEMGVWPWPRNVHAELIQVLEQYGAVAIGYDVNFPEATSPVVDSQLAYAIEHAGNVVLPVELSISTTPRGIFFDPHTVVRPIPLIANAARYLGHTKTPPDGDGVVRSIPLAVGSGDGTETPSFALRLFEIANPDRDVRHIPTDAWNRLRVNYNGAPGKSFARVSASDVLKHRVPPEAIRGHVVLVGATAPDLHDEQIVPTSNGTPMSGVEIHASIYDTLLNARWLVTPHPWVQAGVLLLLGLLVAMLVLFFRARYSLPLTMLLGLAAIVAAILLFDHGIVTDVIWPVLIILFTYVAVTLERRITADRERSKLRNAFSRYVSSPVVESILRDPKRLKLGGEKRRMTVLFSDVRGFTSLSESMSPERLVHLMNTYLSRMTEVVFAYNGVLDKYIGDAVMAFWNAPFEQKDHALRGVKTALAMQRALAEMNRQRVFGPDVSLTIGVGVNTGDMVVGNMGSEARFDYTVIGDNVNLGSRVEGMTKQYGVGILMTEATREEVGRAIVARRIDKVAVKGRHEPTIVYEAIGLASEVTKEEDRLARDFEEAFDRYVNGDFENAIAICGSILQDYPQDGPCRTIIARSHQFLQDPPPSDWDGTWIMKTK